MAIEQRNPCDLCKRKKCYCTDDDGDYEFECALYGYTSKYYCTQYGCFNNYEGSCALGLYDRCGAWEDE